MAEPTKKSDEMEAFLKAMNPANRDRRESIRANICNWCGDPATFFVNDISRREYTISGMCQQCQDKSFW